MGQPQRTSQSRYPGWNGGALLRAGITVVVILGVEAFVCGVAAIPPAALLTAIASTVPGPLEQAVALGAALIPAYALFALCLMLVSAASTWLTGARTPSPATMFIAEMGWPLMRWVRYMAASHVVRVFAGPLFRGTPAWTMYLRLNGARLGRRVYVNSLSVSDHNLLEFGDDVVIGADVHLSGHTVERGCVVTGRVKLDDGVMIGVGSVVEVGTVVGSGTQVGALSFVPKHAHLDSHQVYVGIPVHVLHPPAILGTK